VGHQQGTQLKGKIIPCWWMDWQPKRLFAEGTKSSPLAAKTDTWQKWLQRYEGAHWRTQPETIAVIRYCINFMYWLKL